MRLLVVAQLVAENGNDLCGRNTVLSQQWLSDDDLSEHGLRICMHVILIGFLKVDVLLVTASSLGFFLQVWHHSGSVLRHSFVLRKQRNNKNGVKPHHDSLYEGCRTEKH